MNSIGYQKNIQSNPNFTGRIVFVKGIQFNEKGQVLFSHLKRGNRKALKPLTKYLKHHTSGTYGIGVQENPNKIFVASNIENTRSFEVPTFTRKSVKAVVRLIKPEFSIAKNKQSLFEKFAKEVNKFKKRLLYRASRCKMFFEHIWE